MRLWHKSLIPVLPRQQLLGQWRECCLIAKQISKNGTPNHILVDKIMDYPRTHFIAYGRLVYNEMKKRGYLCVWWKFIKWFKDEEINHKFSTIFPDWHNERYLNQCLYNLQEKYDCGGIREYEWALITEYCNFDN